jgi:hypothetical protein
MFREPALAPTLLKSLTCSVPASAASANKEAALLADTVFVKNKSEAFRRNRLASGTCCGS